MAPPAEQKREEGNAKTAGRGGLAVLFAKAYFIVTGLAQQALLPKVLGHAGYGALSRVLAASNIVNNVVIASATQGVSRATAQATGAEALVRQRLLRWHLGAAAVVALAYAALVPGIVWFQHAPHIKLPLLTMAVVLLVYGVYAPMVGYLNGTRQFQKQAALDVLAATLRTLLLLFGGYLFVRQGQNGVLGAVVGASLASLVVVGIAAVVTRPQAGSARGSAPLPSLKAYAAGLLPVVLAQACTNAVMQADHLLLGRFLSEGASANTADEWLAAYRGCQLFAFLPYQMLFSVTQILFPMLAKVKAEGTPAELAQLVSRGTRLGAIVVGLLVSVVCALPGSLLAFAYDRTIAIRGQGPLHILALAQATFAILGLASTVLVSIGQERKALRVTLIALGTVAAACIALVPGRPFGAPQLMASATAALLGLGLAMLYAGYIVYRTTGAFVPRKTALRVCLAVALAFGVGFLTPITGRPLTIILATLVAVAYLIVLVLTGELGRAELTLLRTIAGKKP